MKLISKAIILGLAILFCMWFLSEPRHLDVPSIENYAFSELAHIAFGMGLGIFFNNCCKKHQMKLVFLTTIAWEIYEQFLCGIKPSMIPFDTLLDIILGITFAYLAIRWVNE